MREEIAEWRYLSVFLGGYCKEGRGTAVSFSKKEARVTKVLHYMCVTCYIILFLRYLVDEISSRQSVSDQRSVTAFWECDILKTVRKCMKKDLFSAAAITMNMV